MEAYAFSINYSTAPGDFGEEKVELGQGEDQPALAANLGEPAENAEEVSFAGCKDHKVFNP